jgi:hypothetical protein
MRLEPKENGTLLTISGSGELRGVMKIFEGMMVRQGRKQTDKDLAALKHLLESRRA